MSKHKTFGYLEIVAYKGQEVIRRIDITDKSEPQIEKLDNGINRQMNHAEYYTFIRESDVKLDEIK
jgi:hypothetical protein